MRKAEFGFKGTPLREQLVAAILRGEKTATAHDRYWRSYADEIRAYLGDPSWDVTDDTAFVAEHFRLVDTL